MADAEGPSCRRSGVSEAADHAAGVHTGAHSSDVVEDHIGTAPMKFSPKTRSRRRLTITLVSTVALLLLAAWLANRPGGYAAERNPHFRYGDVLVEQGKMDEAAAEFREAIRIDPNLAEAHVYLGTILGHQTKLDEAIAEFREAIRIEPNLAEAHAYLGKVLGHQGKLNEAARSLRTAVSAQARKCPGPLQSRDHTGSSRRFGKGDHGVSRGRPAQAQRRGGSLQPWQHIASTGKAQGRHR